MDPINYQANSHKSKDEKVKSSAPEDKKIEKVVTGAVIEKKPGLGQKLKTLFFGGEARGVSRYIAADVLLPTVRNLIVDATTKGVERMVYGETARSRPRPMGMMDPRSRVQYNNPLVRPDRPRLPDQPYRSIRKEPSELILATREEAELVLERLFDILEKYQIVSLADLYELTGLPSSHVDQKWGWTDLRATEVRQIREGCLLSLPPVEEI